MQTLRRKRSESYSDLDAHQEFDIDKKAIKQVIKSYETRDDGTRKLVKNIKKVMKGKKTVDDKDDNGNTILMSIINKFSPVDVPFLLKTFLPLSNDINAKNNRNVNLLILMMRKHIKTSQAPHLLLDVAKRTNTNLTDEIGTTMLMASIMSFETHRNLSLVRYLTEVNNINAQRDNGDCALSLAIKYLRSDPETLINIDEILDRTDIVNMDRSVIMRAALSGLNPVVHYDYWTTIIDKSQIGQWILDPLLKYCSDVSKSALTVYYPNRNAKEKFGDVAKLIKRFMDRAKSDNCNIDFDQPNKYNMTLMVIACKHGALELINTLIDNNVNPNSTNGNETPLESAVMANEIETVCFLFKHGADPNIYKRQPCLFTAIFDIRNNIPKFGSVELIQILLDNGADPNAEIIYAGNGNSSNKSNMSNIIELFKVFDIKEPNNNDIGVLNVSKIRIPIILLCVARRDWSNVAQRLIKAGLILNEREDYWISIRYLLLRHSLSNESRQINLVPYTSIYPMINSLLCSPVGGIEPKDFADKFFITKIDTSLLMLANGGTIMHYIIKMIIDGQLLPSSIRNLKAHGSILAINATDNSIKTPIDLIDDAVLNRRMDSSVANDLKRELLE